MIFNKYGNISLYNCDCLDLMVTLPDASIDVICIDPPYLYLKGQKLEREFDELKFFSECKRILTANGFIIMFGRGESFYRWNTRLSDLGFFFKEEVVWNKSYTTSPLMPLSRVHETISIFCKGKRGINRCKIPYTKMKSDDIPGICQDIKRLRTALGNNSDLEALQNYLSGNSHTIPRLHGKSTTISSLELKQMNRCAATMKTIHDGLNEKSIIKETRDHYSTIHPTQKPVSLLKRLISLVLPNNKPFKEVMVADFFGGSFSTMAACIELGLIGIASEIDNEFYQAGNIRVSSLKDNY